MAERQHTEVAVGILIRDDGALLLSSRPEGKPYAGYWEFPGGNGEDYKQVPNDAKQYQIEAYPKALAAIRTAIGHDKILSIAVPGKKGRLNCIVHIVQTNKLR